VGEVGISYSECGIEPAGFANLLKGFVILPESTVDPAPEAPRLALSRVDLRPQFIGLARLFQVAGDVEIVARLDVELLRLANPLAQLVGLSDVFRRELGLPQTLVAQPELGIPHGEIRVEADGPLEQRHGGGEITFSCQGLQPQAVGLKGFERSRGGLLDGRIELLHRAE